MEEQIKISIDQETSIYGILTKGNNPSKKLLIIVHGLSGSMQEHLQFNAAKFFSKNGFDCFRFNLYGS